MILLKPLTHNFTNEQVLWASRAGDSRRRTEPLTTVVRHFYPVAQQDGYLGNVWRNFNWTYITSKPKGKYVNPPPPEDCPLYWNSGPPYLFTVYDAYRAVLRWTEYAPLTLDVYPEIFAGKLLLLLLLHFLFVFGLSQTFK